MFKKLFVALVLLVPAVGCGVVTAVVEEVKCSRCDGTGLCPWCGGSGKVGLIFEERCDVCKGKRVCPKCKGFCVGG
jgi:DnaJ-class molecular chaperone